MPKNTKKRANKNKHVDTRARTLRPKDPVGQEYGQIMKVLGGSRYTCFCSDGQTRLCHAGKGAQKTMKRAKNFAQEGEWMLISLRDFQESRADIVLKYTDAEVAQLRAMGELPAEVVEDDTVVFGYDSDHQGSNATDATTEVDIAAI